VVETTVELANKVGCAEIVGRIVDDLKDSKEDYRRMVMETIEKVRARVGVCVWLGWWGGWRSWVSCRARADLSLHACVRA
jgi:hypothetical protein